ncbi:glucosamine-6-phosphate deaminase [Candidatus Poribacteria bacterium]|nr:glucosamine-6-phosphate deaminase [Candidatus Poribacteria bacterium]
MKVVVTERVDSYASEYLLGKWHALRVLGLATGSTPEELYGWLVQRFYDGKLSFRDKTTFNLDEYYGLPPNHPQSYRATMHRLLFQYVDLPPSNFHVPPGLTTDVEAACDAYERAIRDAGGVDLWVLGIGTDGHVAFNEPGSEADTRTRLVILTSSTVRNNARFFGDDLSQVPRRAISVGIATIMDGKELLLIAKGRSKAPAIAASVLRKETSSVPASFLQRHANCTFLLDPYAAENLLAEVPKGASRITSESGKSHTLVLEG